MSVEANRELVLKFCRYLSERHLDEMFALMSEDATWSWVGNPETFKHAATRSKRDSVGLITGLLSAFVTWRFDVVRSTAEADRVAVEAKSKGAGPRGETYENEYIMMFDCRDGAVTRIAEFFDQITVLNFEKAMTS